MYMVEVDVSRKVQFAPDGPHAEKEGTKGGALRKTFHLAADDEPIESVCELELMENEGADVVERPAEITRA